MGTSIRRGPRDGIEPLEVRICARQTPKRSGVSLFVDRARTCDANPLYHGRCLHEAPGCFRVGLNQDLIVHGRRSQHAGNSPGDPTRRILICITGSKTVERKREHTKWGRTRDDDEAHVVGDFGRFRARKRGALRERSTCKRITINSKLLLN